MKSIQIKIGKRAFTVVELVIVIAVLAVLAAILIPTFTKVIANANLTRDAETCKKMNTILLANSSLKQELNKTVDEAKDVLKADGMTEEEFKTQNSDYGFYWYSEKDQVYLIKDATGEENEVEYPENDKEIILGAFKADASATDKRFFRLAAKEKKDGGSSGSSTSTTKAQSEPKPSETHTHKLVKDGDYWHCDDCGKYFSDADGKTEYNGVLSITITVDGNAEAEVEVDKTLGLTATIVATPGYTVPDVTWSVNSAGTDKIDLTVSETDSNKCSVKGLASGDVTITAKVTGTEKSAEKAIMVKPTGIPINTVAALNQLESNKKYYLTDNINGVINISGKSGIVLDLNGKTIKNTSNSNSHTMIISGSSSNIKITGDGTIEAYSGKCAVKIDSSSNITIEQISLKTNNNNCLYVTGSKASAFVKCNATNNTTVTTSYGLAVGVANGASLTINGGSYSGTFSVGTYNSKGTIVINNGIFNKPIQYQDDGSKIKVYDGQFNATASKLNSTEPNQNCKAYVGIFFVANSNVASADIQIYGGTFEGVSTTGIRIERDQLNVISSGATEDAILKSYVQSGSTVSINGSSFNK